MNTFSKGQEVLLKVKHLHGCHATVLGSDGDDCTVRINEGNQEGLLGTFPADQLVSLNDANKSAHAQDVKEKAGVSHVMECNSGDRLPWDYNTENEG